MKQRKKMKPQIYTDKHKMLFDFVLKNSLSVLFLSESICVNLWLKIKELFPAFRLVID